MVVDAPPKQTDYAIEIKNLGKTYTNGTEAVKNMSLNVQKGDFFALLGVNGAGKSTTIGMLTTLLTKTTGSIAINGYDLNTQTEQAKRCLGLVPQEYNINVFETSEEILLNQAGFYGVPRKKAQERADYLLGKLGLWSVRKEITQHLSGGMKRRLMIARALVHEPSVLILDEPTAGVDIEIRRSMWDFLTETNQAGTTIILTTHYLEEAEHLCKNIAIIDKGEIIVNQPMHDLLKSLHHQTFVLDSLSPLSELPNLSPFQGSLIDSHTFEMRIDTQFSLNDLFAKLNQYDIRVHSMRNKTNRLEELFMDLIKNGQ